MPAERRRHPRVGLPIGFKFRPAGATVWWAGTVSDLGAGGLRFAAVRPVEPGARIDVQMTLPVRKTAYLFDADVLWERRVSPRSFEYGAAFVGVDAAQQTEIDRLVAFVSQRRSSPPR